MNTRAIAKGKKRPSHSAIPACGLAPQRRLGLSMLVDEASSSRERLRWDSQGEPSFRHDFSQTPVHSCAQAALPRGKQAKQSPGLPAMKSCSSAFDSPRACPFGGACHSCPARIQTKLTVSQLGDKYEQEADKAANRVMSIRDADMPWQEPERKRYEAEFLQMETSSGRRLHLEPNVEAQVHDLRHGGQPLDSATRTFMASSFGYDFSQVRVHADERAAETARSIGARAFTYGHDIAFAANEYAPGTPSGRWLLAHELAHVVQQQGCNSRNHPLCRKVNCPTVRDVENAIRNRINLPKPYKLSKQQSVVIDAILTGTSMIPTIGHLAQLLLLCRRLAKAYKSTVAIGWSGNVATVGVAPTFGWGIYFGPAGEVGGYGAASSKFGVEVVDLSATVALTVIFGGPEKLGGNALAVGGAGGPKPVVLGGSILLTTDARKILGFVMEVGLGVGLLPFEMYVELMKTCETRPIIQEGPAGSESTTP